MSIKTKTEELRNDVLISIKKLNLVGFIEEEVRLMLTNLNYYRLQNIEEYKPLFLSIVVEVNDSYKEQINKSLLESIQ